MWKLYNNIVYDGLAGKLFSITLEQAEQIKNILIKHPEQEIHFDGMGRYAIRRDDNELPVLSNQNHHFEEIVIVLTEQCNLSCLYCPYPNNPDRNHKHHHQKLSSNNINAIIEFLVSTLKSDTRLAFYGGEPLLKLQDTKTIINSLKENRPDWHGKILFTTNFVLFNKGMLNFFIENNVTLVVSLDGPNELHDNNRVTLNGDPTHQLVINNINTLKTQSPVYWQSNVWINAVITGKEFDYIDEYFSFNFGDLSRIQFTLAKPFEHNLVTHSLNDLYDSFELWATNKILNLKDISIAKKNPLLKQFFRDNIAPVINLANVVNERKVFTSCQPGKRLLINTDCTFGICEKAEGFNQGSISMGYTGSDQLAKEFYELLKDKCESCPTAPMCYICYATIWDQNKLSKKLLDTYCDRITLKMDRMMSLYLQLKVRHKNLEKKVENILAK